jgi:hypothetical protein
MVVVVVVVDVVAGGSLSLSLSPFDEGTDAA